MKLKVKVGMLVTSVVLIATLISGMTFALFSTSASNMENDFVAGTVEITPDSNPVFSSTDMVFNNLAPGDFGDKSIIVQNTGSLDAWVHIKDFTLSGVLFEGANPLELTNDEVFNIPAGGSMPFLIHYNLPLQANNDYQGQSGAAIIHFEAIQSRNNPAPPQGWVNSDILSITPIQPIIGIPNGTEKTAAALDLPTQVEVTLDNSTSVLIDVDWDLLNASYDPNLKTIQTFTVQGLLMNLPLGVTNTNNLQASVSVTVDAETEFASGSGTAVDPYIIKTATHLFNVRNHLDAHFLVDNDIDLGVAPYNQGSGWTPIGSINTPFIGTFNGNGHIIENLFIDRLGGNGLFVSIGNHGQVINTHIENVNITATNITGGLVGVIFKGGLVSDSSVTGGQINGRVVNGSQSSTRQLGGLVGFNYGGTINHSDVSSITITGEHRLGGLVGNNWGIVRNSNVRNSTLSGNFLIGGLSGMNYTDVSDPSPVYASIEESSSNANVVGVGNNPNLLGGLVGETSGAKITNSYAKGNVSGNSRIGGLVGSNSSFNPWQGIIENCYAVGHVTGTTDVGGLVGSNLLNGQVVSSYYDSDTTGQSDTGKGTPKSTVDMQTEATFVNWDFTNIWLINANEYPQLR